MLVDTGIDVWLFMKFGVVILLALYLVFAFVLIRQVQQMTKTLEVGFEGVIKLLAWLHFLFAVGTLIVAAVIL